MRGKDDDVVCCRGVAAQRGAARRGAARASLDFHSLYLRRVASRRQLYFFSFVFSVVNGLEGY